MKCKYNIAWVGRCDKLTNKDSKFCEEHSNKKCSSCGEQAVKECPETFMFVCGEPLCSKCKCTRFIKGE